MRNEYDNWRETVASPNEANLKLSESFSGSEYQEVYRPINVKGKLILPYDELVPSKSHIHHENEKVATW